MHDLHDVETRVTDAATGGQKGVKLTQLGALDPVAIIEVSRVAGMGAAKYAPFNYLKGFAWSLLYNAAMRHAMLFWAGESIDPESGLSHAAHAAWMFLALVSFQRRELGTDDRPPVFYQSSGKTIDWTRYEEKVDDYGNPYLSPLSQPDAPKRALYHLAAESFGDLTQSPVDVLGQVMDAQVGRRHPGHYHIDAPLAGKCYCSDPRGPFPGGGQG